VNGLNFGDSIVDNERFGMQRFFYLYDPGGWNQWPVYPSYDSEYYQVLCGKWKDNSPLVYGGNGHSGAGGYGPACRFMFPGESDTLNWGVGCAPPNGPVNWTEETAGNNPGDRRGVQVTGPVTFKPGDVQELDLSFNWARAYGAHSPWASVGKLRQMVDSVRKAFVANRLPGGNSFNGIGDHRQPPGNIVKIYPNPSSEYVTIEFGYETILSNTILYLMNARGYCIKKIVLADGQKSVHMDVSELHSGIYFIRIMTKETSLVKKLVVM